MHLHCIRFYPCIWRFHTIPILNLGTVKTHNPLMGRLNNHFALHICTNLLQFAQNCASIHNFESVHFRRWIRFALVHCSFMPWRHLCEVLLCHICNNCICVFLQDVVTNPQAVDRAVLLSVSFPPPKSSLPIKNGSFTPSWTTTST